MKKDTPATQACAAGRARDEAERPRLRGRHFARPLRWLHALALALRERARPKSGLGIASRLSSRAVGAAVASRRTRPDPARQQPRRKRDPALGDRQEELVVYRPSRRGPALGGHLLARRLVPAARQGSARLSARCAHALARDDQPGRSPVAHARRLEPSVGRVRMMTIMTIRVRGIGHKRHHHAPRLDQKRHHYDPSIRPIGGRLPTSLRKRRRSRTTSSGSPGSAATLTGRATHRPATSSCVAASPAFTTSPSASPSALDLWVTESSRLRLRFSSNPLFSSLTNYLSRLRITELNPHCVPPVSQGLL